MLHMAAQVIWPGEETHRAAAARSTLWKSDVSSIPCCVCRDVEAYGCALVALVMRGGSEGESGGRGPSLSQWQLILHDQSGMN